MGNTEKIILNLTSHEAEVLHIYLSKCISLGIEDITPVFESIVKKIDKAQKTEKILEAQKTEKIVEEIEEFIKIRASEKKEGKDKKFGK